MENIPMFKPGYYYLHANDQIIWKPKIVVEMDSEYFNSDMVIKYWKIETKQEYDLMITEAKNMIAGV
jgi:hypothetical protein